MSISHISDTLNNVKTKAVLNGTHSAICGDVESQFVYET